MRTHLVVALLLLGACSKAPPAVSTSTSGSGSTGAAASTSSSSTSSSVSSSATSSSSSSATSNSGSTGTGSSSSTGTSSTGSTGSSGSTGSTGACIAAGSQPGTCFPGGSECCAGLVCTGVNAGFYCGEPLGGTCTQDSECQVYKFCDAGTCMSRAQLGAACAPSGHYADGGNGGLPGCDTGDDCCAGEGCYPSGAQPFWCMRNPGMACLADDDCGSRVCDAGTCQ